MEASLLSVNVDLGDTRSYDVLIGSGALEELAKVINRAVPKAKRAAIVTQQNVLDALAGAPRSSPLIQTGIAQHVFLVGEGEHHKRLATIETLCDGFAEWGMTRNDVVIAVGGGVVTDVGGFAASCFHRGIPVIYVSTTLLGMIDAAVGGKTGVNLGSGKNLVGAFWQPSAVLCDTDLLATMPQREWACGRGEMAKYHFLGEPELGVLPLETQIARCVALKARVVSADEREAGGRAVLNYGHTLAHALEIAGDHDLRHGEAVAIGLVFAAHLAHVLGRISQERVDEHLHVLRQYDLRSDLPIGSNRDDLITLMGRDKKALDGLTFVLDGPNGVEVVVGVERLALDKAFDAMVVQTHGSAEVLA